MEKFIKQIMEFYYTYTILLFILTAGVSINLVFHNFIILNLYYTNKKKKKPQNIDIITKYLSTVNYE